MKSSTSLSSLLDKLIEFRLFQPSKKDQPPKGDLPFREGQLLDYVEQEHRAKRAGKHLDLRIGDRRGMYSWATKKNLPEPGQKIRLHPQPIHPHSYNDFQGEIPSGYGAGTVRTIHKGKALITSAQPGQTNITVASKRGDHRLALLNTKLGHLLVREKHPEAPKAEKPKYKSVRHEVAEEAIRNAPPGAITQPKIDGALVYVTASDRPEIFSHRKSKQTGRHIIHTERFFRGRPRVNIPKEHQKTLLAELYGTRKGKAIEPQELGGILNAHISESLRRQQERGIKLKATPFDISNGKGNYDERIKQIRETVSYLPSEKFTLSENAKSPNKAIDLFRKIKSGRHPLTREGVVIHAQEGRGTKIKNMEEENVQIHSVFPGKGKDKSQYGGFYYADKHNKPLGKVGTGLTRETRRELPQYIGRTARVRHQGKYKSGRLRAPSLVAIDESR